MQAVTIHDLRKSDRGGQLLAFDLIDLLRAVGSLVDDSVWKATNIWCIRRGEEGPVFESVLTWSQLTAFAASCSQVIDGEFRVFRKGDALPWLAIVASDSTYYAVLCDDHRVLQAVRDSFSDVRDSEEWSNNFVV